MPPRHNSMQRSRSKALDGDLLTGGGRQVLGPRLHGGQLLRVLASITGQGEVLWRRGEAGAFEGHFLNELRRQAGSGGCSGAGYIVTSLRVTSAFRLSPPALAWRARR